MLAIRVITTIIINVALLAAAYSILAEHNVPNAAAVLCLAVIAGLNFAVIIINVALYITRRND